MVTWPVGRIIEVLLELMFTLIIKHGYGSFAEHRAHSFPRPNRTDTRVKDYFWWVPIRFTDSSPMEESIPGDSKGLEISFCQCLDLGLQDGHHGQIGLPGLERPRRPRSTGRPTGTEYFVYHGAFRSLGYKDCDP